MATFNHMVALFQNYPRTKHLYEDFYPAFARNRLFQAESQLGGAEWKVSRLQISKHNFYKQMNVCLLSRVLSRPVFVPSRFLYKQPEILKTFLCFR